MKSKGELIEQIVTTELMKLGLVVAKPIGDNQPFDLIVWNKKKLFKLQIKSSVYKNGCIIFRPTRIRFNKGKHINKPYTQDEVDYFVVYSEEFNKMYLIPWSETTYTTMSLRVLPSKNNQETKKAIDYELQVKYLV